MRLACSSLLGGVVLQSLTCNRGSVPGRARSGAGVSTVTLSNSLAFEPPGRAYVGQQVGDLRQQLYIIEGTSQVGFLCGGKPT